MCYMNVRCACSAAEAFSEDNVRGVISVSGSFPLEVLLPDGRRLRRVSLLKTWL